MARPTKTSKRAATAEPKLSNALLLNKFMLSLFGAASLEELSDGMKDPKLEGYDEDNVSHFYHVLASHPTMDSDLTDERLLKYDNNIYRHTEAISKERGQRIQWKYFQYLSLLFTEIYLDRYFGGRDKLLTDIISFQRDKFNSNPAENFPLEEFSANDLNKLAFWSATGSGKTLIMHMNILQFKHYAEGKAQYNRTILVTPNAGLTQQHLDEFTLSNFTAGIFDKKAGALPFKDGVDIIEITKLGETDGEKTVAVDSFESNNLVLVDEGHRGSSGDVWKTMRDKLSASGFAFEYSATFGQSISSQSSNPKRKAMLNEYGKATLFDYSYRYFYNDGYGKDYQILNMSEAWNETSVYKYLVACLLGFYEQGKLFVNSRSALAPFLLEKPLAVFVGGSVNAGGGLSNKELSDVVFLMKFFQQFISDSNFSIDVIDTLIKGTDGIVDKNNHPIFERSFRYIRSLNQLPEDIYRDMLQVIFNSELSGATLHLDNLKGIDGEIGLRVGNAPYFGIINVGDSSGVTKKCAENGISTRTMDYAEKSLFGTINRPDSSLNILIGSKKFSEGWSSWRVSTMGLLNVGRSEGSQIIQLFGRGVRLKGYNYSLIRSSALDESIKPTEIPEHISTLETLQIFGIRADYMELFKSILEEEGLPTNDSSFEEFSIPVMPTVSLAGKGLKYLKLKKGKNFKKDVAVDLENENSLNINVTLDYYPRISAMRSNDKGSTAGTGSQNEAYFSPKHLQFIDWNKVYFDLELYKSERNWSNLTMLSLDSIKRLFGEPSWYKLLIPEYDMEFTDYTRCMALWQEIVTTLLKMYVEKCYNNVKSKWMSQNVEVAILDESSPNFEKEYKVLIHRDLEHFFDRIRSLKSQLEDKSFAASINISNSQDFQALYIAQHLYQPLLYLNPAPFNVGDECQIKVAPVPLNKGEKDFVESISKYFVQNPDFFAGKELYLLRNKSKKGIGFFDAHGFYPDFMLWLIVGKKQYIAFVDPKGIVHLRGLNDPKIRLAEVIRTEIEPRLNDRNVTLNSYIISNTSYSKVSHWGSRAEFNERHVFFQGEQHDYISKILESMLTEK